MIIMEFGGTGYAWQVLRWDPEYGFSVDTYSCGAIDCCEERFEGSEKISDEEALKIFDKYADREEREENKLIFDPIRKRVYKENFKNDRTPRKAPRIVEEKYKKENKPEEKLQTINFSFIPKDK